MKRSCRVLVLSISIALFALSVCNVHAETTEQLFDIYGEDLGGVPIPVIKTELDKIENVIEEAEREQSKVGWVNSSIDVAKSQYEKLKEDCVERINVIMSTNIKVKHELDSNIYGDINNLISYDAAYKSNIKKMNSILSELDGYSVISYMTAEEIDIDAIMKEYNDTIEQYRTAVDVYELGEVTDVKYILNRPYYVTSEFGNRIDPLNPTTTRYHSGLDLRCETGTEVGVLFNGVVSGCGWSDTSGYWVRVEHGDNVRTFYCHLSVLLCEPGQVVNQYDTIALSGSTGTRCTGPHLHLGVYINGSAVNPALLFE